MSAGVRMSQARRYSRTTDLRAVSGPALETPPSTIAANVDIRRRRMYERSRFLVLAMGTDCAMILTAYCVSDLAYMTLKRGWSAAWLEKPQLGIFAALIFVFMNVLNHHYTMGEYLNVQAQPRRVFSQWNIAFIGATAAAFLGHVIEDSSRGVFVIFYATALGALFVGRAILHFFLREKSRLGEVTVSSALVVGYAADISGVLQKLDPQRDGVKIAAIRVLSNDPAEREAALADAVILARDLLPDDVIIAIPWERTDVIDECVTAFMRVPAALHLNFAADCVMSRFVTASGQNRLMLPALQLHGHSMSGFGAFLKRMIDMVAAAIGLVALSPLFLAIAIAIKLESPGPIFFRQQRYGFNKEPFRIWKFRTMSTVEDGADVRQATRGDPRISRVGAQLRRYNIDELPQLLNVLSGDMSLVGPRPHAIIHDQAFEPNVTLYARRHNAKPGITGWAQVNGYRGETDTHEKIIQRINHDLHYIDNWSLALDLWIIVLTFFSRKAYANAA